MSSSIPSHNASTRAHRGTALCRWLSLALATSSALACSDKRLPAPGETLVLLTTDMQVPDSFDTLVVAIEQAGAETKSYAYSVTGRPIIATSPCANANLSPKRLEFPTTIALTSEREEGVTIGMSLTACKDDNVVFRRQRFDVSVPPPGQLQMLRAPIRWLCSDRRNCYACESPGSCVHQNISLVEAAKADDICRAQEECDQPDESFATAEYEAAEVARHVGAATPTQDCFDPWSCFDLEEESDFDSHAWVPVAAGWAPEAPLTKSQGTCVATLDDSLRGSKKLNLALVLPPGERGFCDKIRCVVPLEAKAAVGWRWEDETASRVILPAATCRMLDSGQILSVMGSTLCSSKSAELPFCGAPREPTTPSGTATNAALTGSLVTHLALDEPSSKTELLDDHNEAAFQRIRETGSGTAELSSDIGVQRRSGVFNSLMYAKNVFPEPPRDSFTWSVWVSPTALSMATRNDPTDAVMPLISNVSADCRTGARLELRACKSRSTLELAFGIPKVTGTRTDGQCSMLYVHAPVGGKTFSGGFSTPWQVGNFYHVAAAYDSVLQQPALYVDGTRVDTPSASCTPPPSIALSDASTFYLGTSAAALETAIPSHDVHLDELRVFDAALASDDIKWLFLETSSVSGPSGLRWGSWGTQGSLSSLESETFPLSFVVADKPYSSGGGFALLGEPRKLSDLTTMPAQTDLSEYDEAVFVANVPAGLPFQFALGGAHGQRQCTWHLQGKAKSTDADSYVINLRKPSWCIDPKCRFDPRFVERVSFGTDWATGAVEPQVFQVKALAFRRRPSADTIPSELPALGGKLGPMGWCWKPITYSPQWELGAIEVVGPSAPVKFANLRAYGAPPLPPEIAADLPDFGGRDLSGCAAVELDIIPVKVVPDPVKTVEAPKLMMQNDFGQNYTWSIKQDSPSARVELLSAGTPYPESGSAAPPNQAAVLKNVTRISVQYAHPIEVTPIRCCATTDGPCEPLVPTL